jgi:hypothetical protein
MKLREFAPVTSCVLVVAMLCAFSPVAVGEEEENQLQETGQLIEQLDDGRYRIGSITVDKAAQSFTVPGTILVLKEPLEYLAVSFGGMKDYESLLELSTSARDFNLACILIGLDDEKSVKPRYQFDELKPQGQAVAISVSWQQEGKTVSVSGANAMTAGEDVFDDDSWVYIGSAMGNYGKQFMAEVGGTLIGFVHDPYSVIDHSNGAGIGAYGLITGNEKVLPPKGSEITLTVTVVPTK